MQFADLVRKLDTLSEAPATVKDPIYNPRIPGYHSPENQALLAAQRTLSAPATATQPVTPPQASVLNKQINLGNSSQYTDGTSRATTPGKTIVPTPPATATQPTTPTFSKGVTDLAKNNNIANPNVIKVGQEITLPSGQKYKVAAGDTLSGINAGQFKGTAPVAAAPDPTTPAAPADTTAATPAAPPAPTTPSPAAPTQGQNSANGFSPQAMKTNPAETGVVSGDGNAVKAGDGQLQTSTSQPATQPSSASTPQTKDYLNPAGSSSGPGLKLTPQQMSSIQLGPKMQPLKATATGESFDRLSAELNSLVESLTTEASTDPKLVGKDQAVKNLKQNMKDRYGKPATSVPPSSPASSIPSSSTAQNATKFNASPYSQVKYNVPTGVNLPPVTPAAGTTASAVNNTVKAADTAADTARVATAATKSAQTAGKIGSRFIPGVGNVVGAALDTADAVVRAKEGDTTGAWISGVGAASNAIPVVGNYIGLGLFGVNQLRDYYNKRGLFKEKPGEETTNTDAPATTTAPTSTATPTAPSTATQPSKPQPGFGSQGAEVTALQSKLRDAGYGNLLGGFGEKGDGVDGKWGKHTQAAYDAYMAAGKPKAESIDPDLNRVINLASYKV